MHPWQHAAADPDRPAIILFPSGRRISYAALDEASNRGAQAFRRMGLKAGDSIALLVRNCPEFLEIYWAGQRAGLDMAMISTHLKPAEAAYIIADSGARALLVSADLPSAQALAGAECSLIPDVERIWSIGELKGAGNWAATLQAMPADRVPDEISGRYLVYSSGTTGRPKGVVLPFARGPIDEVSPTEAQSGKRWGADETMIALCVQPLYHAAPLVFCTSTHRRGATVVLMEKFDAEAALQAIEAHRVTHVQMVPTMFVRLLRLPPEVRAKYDLSSLKAVIHAAAPCPVEVKRQMMEWLGPILYEYYSGSEANGQCFITPEEWLQKPGSVGRAVWGELHVCDETGAELPAGQPGLVYFAGGLDFQYRNDQAKADKARNPLHPTWSTLGDIGYVDDDGYLFLTDRKDFVIISGGVNIYPQATEDLLISHPKVADAAVFGVPDPEFGEAVMAVVEPADWADATPAFAEELKAHCRAGLSAIACPKHVVFESALPRMPTGKLAKKPLRERYWAGRATLTT
jgi:acyl-CoA synthetase (AMP-forming)/AMP-acid ligase II